MVDEAKAEAIGRDMQAGSSCEAGAPPAEDEPGTVEAEPALRLPQGCTLAEAAMLKEQLMAHVGVQSELSLDASTVQRIDAVGLQLLVAFVRERSTSGRTTKWMARSAVFDTAARTLGLDQLLLAEGA